MIKISRGACDMFVEGLNAAAGDAIKLDGKKDEMRGAPVSVETE